MGRTTTSFGGRLRQKRLERGLNQKAIAEAVGVTNAAVSKWESNGGTAISAVVALKLSQHLNVNPFWLVLGLGGPHDKVEIPELSKPVEDLARKIDQLPAARRDAIRRLLNTMHA
jgi:transcriptional regulator with XRE-family HTH domain